MGAAYGERGGDCRRIEAVAAELVPGRRGACEQHRHRLAPARLEGGVLGRVDVDHVDGHRRRHGRESLPHLVAEVAVRPAEQRESHGERRLEIGGGSRGGRCPPRRARLASA